MVSELKLRRLKKKQQILLERRRKQEQQLRAMLKNTSQEAKSLDKQIEEEKYAVTIKLLRQTGFPIDNIALLVGMALKAKELLENGGDEKSSLINTYVSLYTDFAKKLESQKQAEGAVPPEEPSAAAEELHNAEGMG